MVLNSEAESITEMASVPGKSCRRSQVKMDGKHAAILRCKFRARPSPKEQGSDQTEGPENKPDGEFQSDS